MPRPPSYTEMSKLWLLLDDESRRVAAAEQPLIPEPKMATLMRSVGFAAAAEARDVVLRIMMVIMRVIIGNAVVDFDGMSLSLATVHCP